MFNYAIAQSNACKCDRNCKIMIAAICILPIIVAAAIGMASRGKLF